jgi:hypothetical protein
MGRSVAVGVASGADPVGGAGHCTASSSPTRTPGTDLVSIGSHIPSTVPLGPFLVSERQTCYPPLLHLHDLPRRSKAAVLSILNELQEFGRKLQIQAHLDSGTTALSWCWRIERADGIVFGFTEHDRPLEFGGVTYEPESGFAASEIRSGTDLAVDSQEAEGVLTSDTIT